MPKKSSKKKTEDAPKTVPAMIRLPIGACLTAPTKRLEKDMHQVSLDANRAINQALQLWLVYHHQNPQQREPGEKGYTHANRMPSELGRMMRQKEAEVAPHLSAGMLSQYFRSADKALSSRTPWDHPGIADYMWQAILLGETSMWTRRSTEIQFRAQELAVCWDGEITGGSTIKSSGVRKAMLDYGKSSCVIRIPLFSRNSGRGLIAHVARVKVSKLSTGHKNVLKKIVSGEWKMGGSKIVEKNGKWQMYLSYRRPVEPLNLDVKRKAILRPGPVKGRHPFQVVLPDGSTQGIGFGIPVIETYKRQQIRKKELGFRYKGGGAGKGRGRKHARRHVEGGRTFGNMQAHFRRLLTDKLIEILIENNCGTLEYREPTMYVREVDWWHSKGKVPFAWTLFLNDLKRVALKNGIKFPKPNSKANPRLNLDEFDILNGRDPEERKRKQREKRKAKAKRKQRS